MLTHSDYDAMLKETFAKIVELGEKKGGEYAGDVDRLLNFRRNGERLGLPMETIWAVYAAKHWDAIMQFIQDVTTGKQRERMEPIEGRVDDLLVYLLLFKGMLIERNGVADNTFFDHLRNAAKAAGMSVANAYASSTEEPVTTIHLESYQEHVVLPSDVGKIICFGAPQIMEPSLGNGLTP